jgi:hypothetical protein
MLQALRRILRPSISDSLANAFSRLGWIGLWIQIAIGIIPLALIVYAFIFGQSGGAGTRRGLLLVGYLTIAGFLVLYSPRCGPTGTPVLRNASPIRHGAHLCSWCRKLPG